jgi:Phenazine biosynthesis-like protein
MRAIAREFNQSETTFVLASAREDVVAWRLRSFTPAGIEVGGAGHNALGAWWWLAAAGRVPAEGDSAVFAQEIGGRVLPVEVTAEAGSPVAIVMEQESRPGATEWRIGPSSRRRWSVRWRAERRSARAGRVDRNAAPARTGSKPRGRRPCRSGPSPPRGPTAGGRWRGLLPVQPRSCRCWLQRIRQVLQPHGWHLGGSGDRHRRRATCQPPGRSRGRG